MEPSAHLRRRAPSRTHPRQHFAVEAAPSRSFFLRRSFGLPQVWGPGRVRCECIPSGVNACTPSHRSPSPAARSSKQHHPSATSPVPSRRPSSASPHAIPSGREEFLRRQEALLRKRQDGIEKQMGDLAAQQARRSPSPGVDRRNPQQQHVPGYRTPPRGSVAPTFPAVLFPSPSSSSAADPLTRVLARVAALGRPLDDHGSSSIGAPNTSPNRIGAPNTSPNRMRTDT